MTYGFRLNAGGKKPIDITQVTYGSALYFGRPERPDPLNPRLFCPIDWSGFNPNTAKIGIHSGADRFDWGGDVSITADGLWLEQPINYTTDSETPTGLPWCSVIVTALPAATGDAYGLRISNPNGVSPLLIPTRAIQVLSYATVIAGNIGSFDIPGIQTSDIIFVGATVPGQTFSCIRGMSRYNQNTLSFVGDTNGVRILAFRNVGAARVGGYGIRIVNLAGSISISDAQPPLILTDTFGDYTHSLPYRVGFTPVITGTAGWYSGARWRKSTWGISSTADNSTSGIWEAEHWREDAVYADGNYRCRSVINCIDIDMYPEHFGGG
ncbi:hypothetical protein [Serratia odorifera]|uniref:hypothetical protein n=2 Tax=Serratia odorifera TaxID=618 RepID=UPI000B4E74C6|nr:hypothetical protein [Serratia odorifera]PNK91167.1 hypothetical protein CEQ31_016485 [Serratia odorifera]RII74099.1 hypothetical protein DX901_00250 [Serratia odorifera]